MENLKKIFTFTDTDLSSNRTGKITESQRKILKDETSGAVQDLFYIAIVFPSALIILSSIILLIWLFINSPELIREVALGCLAVAFVFYIVRKVLLKDLWDSSTVLTYDWKIQESDFSSKAKMEDVDSTSSPDEDDNNSALYSNETHLPFHVPESAVEDIQKFQNLRIYYNPTHKRILSMEEI